jgi:hypothetical protein
VLRVVFALLPAGTVTAPEGALDGPSRMLVSPQISAGGVLGAFPLPPGLVVVVVGPVVVVVVGAVVVVVVGSVVVVVVGSVVVVVVGGETSDCAVRATVAATGWAPTATDDGQVLVPVVPTVVWAVASATCELPASLTVAPSFAPLGGVATAFQASLPSPRTAAIGVPLLETLGEVIPGWTEAVFTGSVELIPEYATVTIETCVGGLTWTTGLGCPTRATVTHAARRAPVPFAPSTAFVEPVLQVIEVNA